MDTLGFYIRRKFPNLQVSESETPAEFVKALVGDFSGLVLYHGDPFRLVSGAGNQTILQRAFVPAVLDGRCAVLIVDTNVFERPIDCRSPYIHFYSVSVPNRDPNPFEPLFEKLVEEFRTFSSLPDERQMKKIWAEVDPYADYLGVMRLLEEALYAQKGDKDTIDQVTQRRLGPLYGEGLATYSELKREYIRLCKEGALKKNLTDGILNEN